MNERSVVITGLGAVTPFGIGVPALRQGLRQGASAASLISSFDVSQLPTRFAASAPDDCQLDPLVKNQKSLKTMCRAVKLGVVAAQEALKDANLDVAAVDPYRFGVSIGTGGLGLWDSDNSKAPLDLILDSVVGNGTPTLDYSKVWRNTLESMHPLTPLKALPNMAAAHIAINYNARGVCQTISTACTSSAQAIGEAYRQIKFGMADVMIAGGCDSMVNPIGLVAFSVLGILSKNNEHYKTAARPFDKRRDGFMLGEGGAIFLVEEREHCRRRGGKSYGEIIGYATTCDAFRVTDEPREAWSCIQAMRFALKEASIDPAHVDYINAHGTGTRMNDETETFAVKQVFGEHAKSLPISSTKSMIGHLVGAAGAVEFASCVLALEGQFLPPTINYEEPDAKCDLDYVPNTAREASLRVVLSNSFGFGGQNASLVLRREREGE